MDLAGWASSGCPDGAATASVDRTTEGAGTTTGGPPVATAEAVPGSTTAAAAPGLEFTTGREGRR